jgi:hypothetical protein
LTKPKSFDSLESSGHAGNQKKTEEKHMSNTCNGWANYSTWLAACTIHNDEGLFELATQTNNHHELREFFSEFVFTDPSKSIADVLLHNFICAVDWIEVYESVKEEA